MKSKNRGIKMSQLVDRWGIGTVFAFLIIKLLQGAKRIFPPKEDGWRRAARAYISLEHHKFGLGFFGIRPAGEIEASPGDAAEALARRLAEFLRGYPISYVTLDWGMFCVRLSHKKTCEVVLTAYAQDGSMEWLKPFLEPGSTPPPECENELLDLIRESYNDARGLPDLARPRRLRRKVAKGIRRLCRPANRRPAAAYADRILSSACVYVDSLPYENEFQDPEYVRMKPLGFSPLQFHIQCDFPANNANIWVYCNHAAEDGRAILDMMDDLIRQWGRSRPVLYPQSGYASKPVCCSSDGKKIWHVAMYFDFVPFFAERRRLTQAYGVDVPVIALLSWNVTGHPAFAKHRFSLPVEIPAAAGRETSLGFVYILPSKYRDGNAPEEGLLNYLAEFARLRDETKARRSASYEMLESFALLPPVFYKMTLALMPRAMAGFVGTMGLTVLNGAGYIVVTSCDSQPEAFISFGSLNLPSQDGGTVGAVSIKCRPEKIEFYANALREIFGEARATDN
ncbi:MAG TPA: hypothetical protein VN540_01430 [Clostridia bacterium]|nr:hypothetical protein [Clostridia bacterium]